MRWLRRAVAAALVASLLGFVTEGADGPPDPAFGPPEVTTTTTAPAPAPTPPPAPPETAPPG